MESFISELDYSFGKEHNHPLVQQHRRKAAEWRERRSKRRRIAKQWKLSNGSSSEEFPSAGMEITCDLKNMYLYILADTARERVLKNKRPFEYCNSQSTLGSIVFDPIASGYRIKDRWSIEEMRAMEARASRNAKSVNRNGKVSVGSMFSTRPCLYSFDRSSDSFYTTHLKPVIPCYKSMDKKPYLPAEIRLMIWKLALSEKQVRHPVRYSQGDPVLASEIIPKTPINILSLSHEMHNEVAQLLYAETPLVLYVTSRGIFASSQECKAVTGNWHDKFYQPRSYWTYARELEIRIQGKTVSAPDFEPEKVLDQNISYLCNRLNTLYLPALSSLKICIQIDRGFSTCHTRLQYLKSHLRYFEKTTLLPNEKGLMPTVGIRGPEFCSTILDAAIEQFEGCKESEAFHSELYISQILSGLCRVPVYDESKDRDLAMFASADEPGYFATLKWKVEQHWELCGISRLIE